MSVSRQGAAGAYDPQHGFVITGGSRKSAENTYDGIHFNPLPDMPEYLSHHCLVSLKNGDLLAIDRWIAIMYHGSNNSWSKLDDIPGSPVTSTMTGMLCGSVEEDGNVKEVIAAGGQGRNDVFIYSLETGTWRSGMVYLMIRST